MKKNRKRLMFLVSMLLILGAGYVFVRYTPLLTVSPSKTLFSIPDSEITGITLTGEGSIQTLVKKGDLWYVLKGETEYRADQDEIANLLKVLHGLTQETVVSRNRKKHTEEFGVGKSNVLIKGRDSVFTLYVGFPHLGNDNYARVDKQDAVFIGKDLGSIHLDWDWRDLDIPLLTDTEKVGKIEVDYNGKTVLTKSEKGWSDQYDNPIPVEAIDSYFGRIQLLQAVDLLTENPADSDIPELTIRLTTADKETTAQFYSYQDEYSTMKVTGSEYIYVIRRQYVLNLQKSNEDFLAPEPTIQP